MTYLKGALSIICLVFLTTIAEGQKNWTKEADLTYQAEAYFGAVDAYKKAYTKEKKQSEKARILFRIGDCYRNLQDEDQAQVWYDKAIAAEFDEAEIFVRYGDILRKKGDYEGASAKYRAGLAKAQGPLKKEAENGIASCEKAVKLLKQPARYKVENEVQLNTAYYDFSCFFADKKHQSIMFSSTRPGGAGGADDAITGEGFSDIFISQRDNKGKWSAPVPTDPTINSAANEGSPWLDSKYSQLYFTRCGYEKKETIWMSNIHCACAG